MWLRTGRRKELLHVVSVALVPRPDAEGGGGQMALGVTARLPREPHCSCEEIAATRVHANDDAVVIHAQASGPCMAAQRSGRNGIAGSCVSYQPYPIQSHTCRQLRLTACNSTCRAAGWTEAFLEALPCHRSRHETDVVGGRAWQRPGLGSMMHRGAWAQHSAVVASSVVFLHTRGKTSLPARPLVRSTFFFFLRLPLRVNLLAPGLGGVGTARAEGEAAELVLASSGLGWAGAGAESLGRKRWKSTDTQSVLRIARLICVYAPVLM